MLSGIKPKQVSEKSWQNMQIFLILLIHGQLKRKRLEISLYLVSSMKPY